MPHIQEVVHIEHVKVLKQAIFPRLVLMAVADEDLAHKIVIILVASTMRSSTGGVQGEAGLLYKRRAWATGSNILRNPRDFPGTHDPVGVTKGTLVTQRGAIVAEKIVNAAGVAIGYIRVSTEEQVAEGVSLAAQRAKVVAYCGLHGLDLAHTYADEGLSGKRADNRPGLQEAIQHACDGHGVLAVYSLSRLARSTRDAIDITDRLSHCGADLISITERIDTTTSMGRFFFTTVAAPGPTGTRSDLRADVPGDGTYAREPPAGQRAGAVWLSIGR